MIQTYRKLIAIPSALGDIPQPSCDNVRIPYYCGLIVGRLFKLSKHCPTISLFVCMSTEILIANQPHYFGLTYCDNVKTLVAMVILNRG